MKVSIFSRPAAMVFIGVHGVDLWYGSIRCRVSHCLKCLKFFRNVLLVDSIKLRSSFLLGSCPGGLVQATKIHPVEVTYPTLKNPYPKAIHKP